jgi:hypothetical protein
MNLDNDALRLSVFAEFPNTIRKLEVNLPIMRTFSNSETIPEFSQFPISCFITFPS